MIRLLTNEEKEQFAEVFDKEFDGSGVPYRANVAAVVEDGEIQGFIVAESLVRVGCIWAKPELRGTMKAALNSRRLAEYVHDQIPEGLSAIVIASDIKFEPLLKKLEMREVEGRVFRKDF